MARHDDHQDVTFQLTKLNLLSENLAAAFYPSEKSQMRPWQKYLVQLVLSPQQCVTRSLFQFSRREREFLSFNLMFSREFLGITSIACLLTDIFKKRLLVSQFFQK